MAENKTKATEASVLLKRLGKHVLSGSCLHIKKLSEVDLEVLRTLITDSFAQMRTKYAS